MTVKLRVAASLAAAHLCLACCDLSVSPVVPDLGADRPPDEPAPVFMAPAEDAIPDQYLVLLSPGVRDIEKSATELAAKHGGRVLNIFTQPAAAFTITALDEPGRDALGREAAVASIQQDQWLYVENVPASGRLQTTYWGLDQIDSRTWTADGWYNFPGAGTGVRVYIVDSGIFTRSALLTGSNVHEGFDGTGSVVSDCNGHGTHVAGIVGGAQTGVASDVTLISVRVVACSTRFEMSRLASGLAWIARHHPEGVPGVVNMSLGTNMPPDPMDVDDEGLTHSVANVFLGALLRRGLVVVAAAGNSNADACYTWPALVPGVITVGAVMSDGRRPTPVNWGVKDGQPRGSNYGRCVDIFAPGDKIASACIPGVCDRGSDHLVLRGTSMAAPFVAGAAALYLERNPKATPDEVAAYLTGSATRRVVQNAGPGSPDALLYVPDGTDHGWKGRWQGSYVCTGGSWAPWKAEGLLLDVDNITPSGSLTGRLNGIWPGLTTAGASLLYAFGYEAVYETAASVDATGDVLSVKYSDSWFTSEPDLKWTWAGTRSGDVIRGSLSDSEGSVCKGNFMLVRVAN